MNVRKPLLLVGGRKSITLSWQIGLILKRASSRLIKGLFWGVLCLVGCSTEPAPDLSLTALRAQSEGFPYETLPSFQLTDVNPGSATYEERRGPEDYRGHVNVWYFVHASCPYCRGQFKHLADLAEQITTKDEIAAHFLAVNGQGHAEAVDLLSEEGTLPVLQDEKDADVWGLWQISYRDVVVANADLQPIARINLTEHDLGDAEVYDALRDLVLDVAENPAPK